MLDFCDECRELLDRAAIAIRLHSHALALAQEATENPTELSDLNEMLRNASLARENSVAEYQRHIGTHAPKTASAGQAG
jgi:hypothetical protein